MSRLAASLVLAAAALSGCNRGANTFHTSAEAYLSWWDRFQVRTGFSIPGDLGPCMKSARDPQLGKYYYSIPLDRCVKMTPARRWRGLWRYAFEGSQFCAAPAKDCGYVSIDRRTGPDIWLDVDRVTTKTPDGALYAVDFIGRRTAYAGSYGHMGMSDHELIVDRFISMKQIGPPKRENQTE